MKVLREKDCSLQGNDMNSLNLQRLNYPMADKSDIKFTISFTDQELNLEERDEQAQKLLNQMKDLDELEEAGRVLDPNPPAGNKALGGFLPGIIKAVIKTSQIKQFMGFMGDRLSGKTIEMEVTANGKSLKVKVSNQAELTAAVQAAEQFIMAGLVET
ncbi:MAG: hypothetical protein QNJ70_23170 [Xenococcaceae cyanobacterium MO_207.B15]|nr:hypothetical protein [Xenococcaceae cyanobacterium MO_207.B15]